MTATQLVRQTGLARDTCSDVIDGLLARELIKRLNPNARRNCLYWLTFGGVRRQQETCASTQKPPIAHYFPDVDWNLFGEVCFRHRAAVLKAMQGRMQAVKIRRRACSQYSILRMSANNTRDTLYEFLRMGVVQSSKEPKQPYPFYELTELGMVFQKLLLRAEGRLLHD